VNSTHVVYEAFYATMKEGKSSKTGHEHSLPSYFRRQHSMLFVNMYVCIKVKVKLSLCLIKHYAIKAYGGMDVQIHIFLISALVGGEWSA
jgi:hypothetical protein